MLTTKNIRQLRCLSRFCTTSHLYHKAHHRWHAGMLVRFHAAAVHVRGQAHIPQQSVKHWFILTSPGRTATQGCDRCADPAAGMAGGASRLLNALFWRESDKSQGPWGRRPHLRSASFRLVFCSCQAVRVAGEQSLGASGRRSRRLSTPTARTALEDVPVMQHAIEHGADCGDIAQQLPPVLDWSVRCQQCTDALVAAHDDLQQIFGCS